MLLFENFAVFDNDDNVPKGGWIGGLNIDGTKEKLLTTFTKADENCFYFVKIDIIIIAQLIYDDDTNYYYYCVPIVILFVLNNNNNLYI